MRLLMLYCLLWFSTSLWSMAPTLNWNKAMEEVIQKYALRTEPELERYFKQAKMAYPPKEIALLAFKKERKIELWAKNANQGWRFIHPYPLTAFSGELGPKLRERDGQIPEGIYRLVNFNPFSTMHLSMMIDYPNTFDKLQAQKEGRRHLGDNIFLHGKALSAGCLAVGDRAIDQLFLLARRVGLNHVKLIIAPNDLRIEKPATARLGKPRWLPELYKNIKLALHPFSSHPKMLT